MARKTQHVVPDPDGGWNVKKGGAKRASKHFDKKADAEKWATDVAKNQNSELIVHKKMVLFKTQTVMATTLIRQKIRNTKLHRLLY